MYEHEVPADEIEELADLKQQWHMVKKKAFEVNGNLQSLQGGFRGKLLEGVVEFIDQVKDFRAEFEAKGPMRPGLAPIEAAEVLKTYQRYYESIDRKWKTFSQGEEMFALQVTHMKHLAFITHSRCRTLISLSHTPHTQTHTQHTQVTEKERERERER